MSMNIMELLLLVDARLRPLLGADESALQAVIEEVAAGPRAEGVPPEVEPRAVLAGQLVSIEAECRMLRESLHVELTFAAQAEVKVVMTGPSRPRTVPTDPNAPVDPNAPTDPNKPE